MEKKQPKPKVSSYVTGISARFHDDDPTGEKFMAIVRRHKTQKQFMEWVVAQDATQGGKKR